MGSKNVFVYSFRYFYINTQVVHLKTLSYFSSICIILFPLSIFLARTYGMMLKSSGRRGYPCLVSDLSKKASGLSILSTMLAIGFP